MNKSKLEELKKEILELKKDLTFPNKAIQKIVRSSSHILNIKKAELKGRQEREQEILNEIKIAGRCLAFLNFKCNNKNCLNKFCPAFIKKRESPDIVQKQAKPHKENKEN